MTDNDIIKMFECCIKANTHGDCEKLGCPAFCKDGCQLYLQSDDPYEYTIFNEQLKFALDLNKRQKAENERLTVELKAMRGAANSYKMHYNNAIKEFAERLEKELYIKQDGNRKHWTETLNRHRGTEAYKDHEWSIDNWLRGYGEAVQDVLGVFDNLVKEMTEE